MRNNGQERIGPLNTGRRLVGSLLNASHEPVGGYTGWIAGTGLAIDLEPGGSASINVIFGTASSREELGYALPPGEYWLKVHVPLRRGRGEQHPRSPSLCRGSPSSLLSRGVRAGQGADELPGLLERVDGLWKE